MRDRRGSYVGFAGVQGSTVYEDSTYPNIVLLIHFDGAENGTTFTDVSLNNFAVNRTGTVNTTTANFKFGTGSLVLKDVTNSYLYLGPSPAGVTTASRFNFGLEDYTAEAWVLLTAYKLNGSYVFDCNANTNGFNLYIDSAGRIETTQRNNVALLNPTVRTSQSYTAPVIVLPQKFGAAADPYYANVVLATPLDLGSSSTTVVDVSPTPKTLTFTGGAQISTAASTSNGASAYIDGATTSSILAPSTTDFDLPADFVIELRVRFSPLYGYNSNYGSYVAVLLSRHDVVAGITDANTGFELLLMNYYEPAVIQLRTGIGTTAHNFNGATIPSNTWHHIAVVRSNGWITAYLNGVQYGVSVFDATPLTPSSPRNLSVGQSLRTTFKAGATLTGHIDDLCITKDSARDYVTTVTPLLPTAAFPTSAPADPYFSSVQLLLPMDGVANTFVDLSPTPRAITARGNVTQSAAQTKWPGNAAFFDGVNDYLEMPSITLTGDWLIEAWVYITDNTRSYYPLIETRATPGAFQNYVCGLMRTVVGSTVTYRLDFVTSNFGSRFTGTSVEVKLNTWQHVAFFRTGTTIRGAVDGVIDVASYSFTGNLAPAASTSRIGSTIDTPNVRWAGYIDDFRVTVGSLRGILPTNNAVLTGRLQRNLVFATTNHNLNISDSVYLQFPAPLTSSTGVYALDNIGDANQFSVVAPTAITTSGTATVTALPPLTGTYDHAGTEITVTCANHGFVARNSVSLTVLTGSGRTGTYVVARVVDVNTFVLTSATSLTATGFAGIVAAVPLNEWTHVALTRRAGITTSYLNGKPIKQTAVARNYNFSVTNNIIIGTREGGGSESFAGNIDELAVSNIARYSAPFTPLVAPYSEAIAPVSGFWSQREAEQYQRLNSWVGETDIRADPALSLWLDAANLDALWLTNNATTNNGARINDDVTTIGRWQDASNSARHFIRPATTTGLKRVLNGKNGLPIVRFNGTSTDYFTGPNWNTLASSAGYTIFIVARIQLPSTDSIYAYERAALLSAQYFNNFSFSPAVPTSASHHVHNGTARVDYTFDTWGIFTLNSTASTSTSEILLNNNRAQIGITTGTFQNSANATDLGRNNYNFSNRAVGADVAEILFFNAPQSIAAQTRYYNYLRNKWAIT